MRVAPFRFMRRTSTGVAAPALEVPLPPLESDDEPRYKPIEWGLVKRLLAMLAPHKRQYTLAISLGLAQLLLDMQSPRFVQHIADYVGLPGIARPDAIRHILLVMLLWATVFAGSVFLQRLTILFMTRAGEAVQFTFRRRLFEHLQTLSMSYYDKTKLGRIISRCTSDISAMRDVNVWGVWRVIANLVRIGVAAGFLLWTDYRLFLSVAWLGVVLFYCNRLYLKKSSSMFQVAREGYTRVSTNLAENITGMRVVTAFNRQDPNLDVFNHLQNVNTSNNVAVSRVTGAYLPLLQSAGYLGKAIILAYGGYLVAAGSIGGVGAVLAAFLYWDIFTNSILDIGNFYNVMMMAMASAERVFNLLDTQPDVSDVPGATPLPRIEGRVTFEHVTFGYNPDRPVLHDVSFEARPGQTFALVGATGSGKSSIISLIARFYQPQQGRVLVDGHDIRHVTSESLHRQMGLVLQTNYLFTGTVTENIRYARTDATARDVVEAARAIGSYDAIMSLKDGFDTEVGERGGNMSLGQRQLICFTRAFLADPRIFMLDEATSAVDTATELLVQNSLERLLAGRTTFIVAHRLSTIMRADQILVIEAGRIIERGRHDELLEREGKYASLYEQFARHAE
jgi:ATP-binding cassette, subfamily B, multidrug efflux pump